MNSFSDERELSDSRIPFLLMYEREREREQHVQVHGIFQRIFVLVYLLVYFSTSQSHQLCILHAFSNTASNIPDPSGFPTGIMPIMSLLVMNGVIRSFT